MSGGFISSLFKKKAEEEEPSKLGLAKVFKYEELKKATNNFNTELGNGGFGRVYLGKLRDGQMVAVKVLYDRNPKRLEQFFNEVIALSRLHHKNLVSLYGCTNPRGQELLLVYEYAPNGTIADHLHGRRSNLNWAVRVQMAVETAEALSYLHALQPPIIHRDVKTSNILLDNAFHVRVADLGICRLLPYDTTHVTTMPQGTIGYRDPEYEQYFRLTDKTDVYSFGVVLMELISGQQAVDVNRDPEDIYLDEMVLKNKKLEELVDSKLAYHSNDDVKRMINSVAELSMECLQPKGDMRPPMVQVVIVLKRIQNEMQQIGLNDVDVLSFDPQQELGECSLNNATGLKLGGPGPLGQPLNMESPFMDLATIQAATGDFSNANKLGEGGFGPVYKGTLHGGREIAVKRLSTKSKQGAAEFKNEVKLAKLQHRNLVRVLGCCVEREEQLLIYEYLPNKSLDAFIFDENKRSQLDWKRRHLIISGIARGLLYLHEDSLLKVIHRDLKASNVLLDNAMNPKISDFGMAKIFETDVTDVNTGRVVGTYGYMAPEYVMDGIFSAKSDVYSFGVLLLEIVSGQKNGRSHFEQHGQTLPGRVWQLWNAGRAMELIDVLLGDSYPQAEAMKVIHIGLLCVQEKVEERPTMSSVVLMLRSDQMVLRELTQPPTFFRQRTVELDLYSSTKGHSIYEVTITEPTPR